YYSSAYYENPEAEMERKGWLGADLIFDIDADHIETPCKAEHDRWRCKDCGFEGRGETPERCPRCGGTSFKEEKWICNRCLDAARHEAQKLLDILIGDFGFSPIDELEVSFTGHRGYHIHVSSPNIRELDQPARREIVDYILGTGIKAELHGFKPSLERLTTGEGGWRDRLIKALYDYLEEADLKALMEAGLSRATASKILEIKDRLLQILWDGRPGLALRLIRRRTLDKLVEAAVGREASAIDTVVTTDLHRLIRLPGTLHGKTGLIAQRVSVEGLDDYDPLVEAVAFKDGMLKVYVERAPRFSIGGAFYGPYIGEEVELPMEAALYLLCKGAARLAG
ncbi:hypothetical protein J7L65_05120, partial [Candidatus Bathyarchaeota archaeon]|nr:hypothetical protein [Candidatus Bathyarchaeota archaeon]